MTPLQIHNAQRATKRYWENVNIVALLERLGLEYTVVLRNGLQTIIAKTPFFHKHKKCTIINYTSFETLRDLYAWMEY